MDCGEGQCVTEDGANKCVCPNGMQYNGTSCSSECIIVKWYIQWSPDKSNLKRVQFKSKTGICTTNIHIKCIVPTFVKRLWPRGYF